MMSYKAEHRQGLYNRASSRKAVNRLEQKFFQ